MGVSRNWTTHPSLHNLRAAHVRFVDGAHTKWHYHTGEQLLMPTDGLGFVELRGLPFVADSKRRTRVFVPAGVWHRHGARKGTDDALHIAVTTGETVWASNDDCVDDVSPRSLLLVRPVCAPAAGADADEDTFVLNIRECETRRLWGPLWLGCRDCLSGFAANVRSVR